ncbi:hypothetical protein G9A89_005996 [Geosiphon pyriformis]|nr:hypothetical protein G9A89_005996 [Geosiphon pyriformis]
MNHILGFFMVLVSNRQVIVSLARSKQLRTIQDWPFEDNALVAFEDSMNANVMIHGGIYQSYLLAQSQIVKNAQEIISQPDHQNFEIIVTGVGLGGAYAVLAALDIRQKVGTNPIKVYTYGQPRIGNTEFANYVDSLRSGLQIYRITYKKDYVPLYPDADSYLHTQEEYWISQRDDWIFQCSNVNGGENQECINSRRKNKEDTSPHNGPYFGTTMGKCAFSKL